MYADHRGITLRLDPEGYLLFKYIIIKKLGSSASPTIADSSSIQLQQGHDALMTPNWIENLEGPQPSQTPGQTSDRRILNHNTPQPACRSTTRRNPKHQPKTCRQLNTRVRRFQVRSRASNVLVTDGSCRCECNILKYGIG